MDTVIEKISEIELTATAIMEDASQRKKAFADEMAKRTAAFDARLEAETGQKIKELQADMEIRMNERLIKQQDNCAALLKAIEKRYEEHHVRYVEDLFQSMIKE